MSIQKVIEKVRSQEFSKEEVLTVLKSVDGEKLKKELAKNLEYLINCQRSDNRKVRNLTSELALMVEKKELAKQLKYLVSCQNANHNYVRSIGRDLVLKAIEDLDKEELKKWMGYLIQDTAHYTPCTRSAKLALKVMKDWAPEELAKHLTYFVECQNLPDRDICVQSRELALKVAPEELAKHLTYFVERQSSFYNILCNKLALELTLKINKDDLKKRLKDIMEWKKTGESFSTPISRYLLLKIEGCKKRDEIISLVFT